MKAELGAHFGMHVPEGWTDFNERAMQLASAPDIARSVPAWHRQALELAYDATELTNENLDEYRYYYMGLGICELAKVLRDPDARDEAIQTFASSHISRHNDYCDDYQAYGYRRNDGMRIGELRSFGKGFSPLTNQTADRLPPHIGLASHALRSILNERCTLLERPKSNYKLSDHITVDFPGDVIRQSLQQFPAAASALTVIALRNLYNKGEPVSSADRARYDPILTDVIDPAAIGELNLLQLARRSARLRLDEFNDGDKLDSFLEVDVEGNTTFNVAMLANDPGELPAPNATLLRSLHKKRLRCPALSVNGVIEAALQITGKAGGIAATKLHARRIW